jgi:16S rRNA (uracil1498-N3)-methyltransferase
MLVAFEGAPRDTLEQALSKYERGNAIVIAIGPEGGLHGDEVAHARARGAQIVSLGPTILRTETAAAALLAAVAARLGWW